MFSYSSDCGSTWTAPQKVSGVTKTNQGAALAIDSSTGNVYIVWRVFNDGLFPDGIAGSAFQYRSNNLSPVIGFPISPFDQGTTGTSFRTNAYPSVATDANGIFYLGWSQRGSSSDKVTGGDARIQVITGKPVYSTTSLCSCCSVFP